MAFYTGDLFPKWKGNLFVGALAGQLLVRLTLDGEKVVGEERIKVHRPHVATSARGPMASSTCCRKARARCCGWSRRAEAHSRRLV